MSTIHAQPSPATTTRDERRQNPSSAAPQRRHHTNMMFTKATTSITAAACLLAAMIGSSATTNTQTADAFVPTVSSQRTSSSYRQRSAPLFYAMPDIASMKAMEMKNELESYGINTKSLFDKRDFESALMEARRDYEQTIKDVMGSTTNGAYNEKKTPASSSRQSQQSQNAQSFYDRTRRQSSWNSAHSSSTAGHRAYNGVGLEEGPLNRHEQQYRRYQQSNPYYQDSPHQGYYQPGPREPYYHPGRGPPPPPSGPRYDDPAVQMKYHQAMQKAHGMKVDDMQKELNGRGVSTKFCMVFADFCQLYAEAVAEDKIATNNAGESYYEDDYDPSYKDVVMQKYDPSQLF